MITRYKQRWDLSNMIAAARFIRGGGIVECDYT